MDGLLFYNVKITVLCIKFITKWGVQVWPPNTILIFIRWYSNWL